MKTLNKLGGKHGVGRVDLVENRFVGMKSRGVYETPGGAILHFAHRQMESLTMDREVMHLRDSLIPKYAELVYYGFWFAPERQALQALVDQSQRKRHRHRAGQALQGQHHHRRPQIAGVPLQPAHRHDGSRLTKAYNQDDATGFIRLQGLRLRARYAVGKKKAEGKKVGGRK